MKFCTKNIAPTAANINIDTTMVDIENDSSAVVSNNETKVSKDSNADDDTDTTSFFMNVKAIGCWKKIGLIAIVGAFITLLAFTVHFYKESRAVSLIYDATTGEMMAEKEVIRNTTDGVGCDIYSNKTTMEKDKNETNSDGNENRELQTCPVMRFPITGKGSTALVASMNCHSTLFAVYCSYRCPSSFNTPIYNSRRRQWSVQCYCGHNGQWDRYP